MLETIHSASGHDHEEKLLSGSNLNCQVVRRNGKRTPFDASKITLALTKAFIAVEGDAAKDSERLHRITHQLTETVVAALRRRLPEGGLIYIEDIQDQVELALMRAGEHKVARAYVLYREQHAAKRQAENKKTQHATGFEFVLEGQKKLTVTRSELEQWLVALCDGLSNVEVEQLKSQLTGLCASDMSVQEFLQSLLLKVREHIELDPDYSQLCARLLLVQLHQEHRQLLGLHNSFPQLKNGQQLLPLDYSETFIAAIQFAVEQQLLDERLLQYDLQRLSEAINPQADLQFHYLGLQTLYDRYFIHHQKQRLELPQIFFMRVAMGLAINEEDREQKAIEFYQLLSAFDFMCSTPTLFNSGTLRPQLSSCYLTTVPDDLAGIYNSLKDNALLSKFAGGLGNDWTPVRARGAHIKGTNGESQGVIPFLKVANDTAVAVNQGGKRKGAVCAYLETWHIDIEDFIDLRKNTGDERRRTHDMNTAHWIPDLFMERVNEKAHWTLFSPDEVSDLHELCGEAFREKYLDYEKQAEQGLIKRFKQVDALSLWRKMLTMLFETGHPWITFKDACNLRYTNQHVGVVHSSNLCTEITLHTNQNEIAVCNLGSVNLAKHIEGGQINKEKLQKTVQTAMRMLDNVIDYNYYSVNAARVSNMKHRPVGLGIMGFQDALYQLDLPYSSEAAVKFADQSMELISYYAISASNQLAKERGSYSTFKGSLWSQGILPIDSIKLLADNRRIPLQQDSRSSLDWETLRQSIKQHGMRNSNCLAIAPTATISNICHVSQSIEPTYQNLYVKSNLSGEFTVVNPWLVKKLKALNLWDEMMINDLKYYDGSVQAIERVPATLKKLFATAFEIEPDWLIEAASRRQKWIDQSQSLNLYLAEPSGKKLDNIYQSAWKKGLKTTYYLRSLGATQLEKLVDKKQQSQISSETPKVCSILDPDCEACQ